MQNSPEWLEFRKNKIGASDAASILGVSPFKTKYELWEEKVGVRQNRRTAAMQRGHDLEEEARQAFERETKIIVFPQVKVSAQHNFMMASLDGMDIEEQNFVEIKCPGVKDHEVALQKKVPEKYYPQLQHQLSVTGLDIGYYFSYRPGSTALIEVRRNDEFIEMMIDEEKKFHQCVIEFLPPCDPNFEERTDEEWKRLSESYSSLTNQMEVLGQQEKEVRERFIALANGRNVKGFGTYLSKVLRKGTIDYKNIPELASIDVEKYRKSPTEYWKISQG